mgnify:CR=1 FL=1
MKSLAITWKMCSDLGEFLKWLGYLCIYDSEYEITYGEFDGENLILEMKLPCKLPQKFSNGNEQFYLTGEDELVKFIVKAENSKLKQYYPNPKDIIIFQKKIPLSRNLSDPELTKNTGKQPPKIPAIPGTPAPMLF